MTLLDKQIPLEKKYLTCSFLPKVIFIHILRSPLHKQQTAFPTKRLSTPAMSWFFKVAKGWEAYGKEKSDQIEDAFQKFHSGLQKEEVVSLDQWRVDFQKMSLGVNMIETNMENIDRNLSNMIHRTM